MQRSLREGLPSPGRTLCRAEEWLALGCTLSEGVWRADVRGSEMGQLLREAPNAVVAAVATAGAALHWEGLGTKAAAICRYRATLTVQGFGFWGWVASSSCRVLPAPAWKGLSAAGLEQALMLRQPTLSPLPQAGASDAAHSPIAAASL